MVLKFLGKDTHEQRRAGENGGISIDDSFIEDDDSVWPAPTDEIKPLASK